MKEQLIDVFKSVLKVDPVSNTIVRGECRTWDSIGHINLVVEIEETFDIELFPEEIENIVDLDSAWRIIEKKLGRSD